MYQYIGEGSYDFPLKQQKSKNDKVHALVKFDGPGRSEIPFPLGPSLKIKFACYHPTHRFKIWLCQ